MCELKRVMSRKKLLLFLFIMILNVVCFLYTNLQGNTIVYVMKQNEIYTQLCDKYKSKDLEEAFTEISEDDTADSLEGTEKDNYQKQLIYVKKKLMYLKGYTASVDAIIANADHLKKYSIFTKNSSFSYSNIIQTASDFKRVEDVDVALENDKAVDAFLKYYYLYYFALGMMIIIIYDLFKERDNHMWTIVYTTTNGRRRLSCIRIAAIWISSFFITAALFFSVLFESLLLYGGWESLCTPIQTISEFEKFSYPYSKLQYILMLFLMTELSIGGVATIIWAIFVFFRKRNVAIVLFGIIIGLEWVLYSNISITSVCNFLKYLNIINLLRMNELYQTYLNWGIHEYVFSVISIVLFFFTVLIIIITVIATETYEMMRPEKSVTVIQRLWMQVSELYQRALVRYCMILKEFHKLLFTSKGIWTLMIILLLACYVCGYGKMTFTDTEKEYDAMYLEHGGEDPTYLIQYLDEKQLEMENVTNYYLEIKEKYQNGECEQQEYIEAVSAFNYAGAKLGTLTEYQEKLEHIEQMRQQYHINAWLISDRGYEEVFGSYSEMRELILMILLIVAVTLIIAESFYMEYHTGMQLMIHSYVNGRQWISKRKVIACIMLTTGFTVVVYAINLIQLRNTYGLPFLNAPVASLTFVSDYVGTGILKNVLISRTVLSLSIKELLLVRFLIRLFLSLCSMGVALLLSRFLKGNKNRAVIIMVMLAEILCCLIVLHQLTIL